MGWGGMNQLAPTAAAYNRLKGFGSYCFDATKLEAAFTGGGLGRHYQERTMAMFRG